MDTAILVTITYKYENIVFPNLNRLIVNYLHQHPEKINKYASNKIRIERLLYYLRNQDIKTQEDLLNKTIYYVEEMYA